MVKIISKLMFFRNSIKTMLNIYGKKAKFQELSQKMATHTHFSLQLKYIYKVTNIQIKKLRARTINLRLYDSFSAKINSLYINYFRYNTHQT